LRRFADLLGRRITRCARRFPLPESADAADLFDAGKACARGVLSLRMLGYILSRLFPTVERRLMGWNAD